RTLHAMAAAALRKVWREASAGVHDPLAAARASLQLDYQMRSKFGEPLMTENASTPLGARVHAVLYDMDAHLSAAPEAADAAGRQVLTLGTKEIDALT